MKRASVLLRELLVELVETEKASPDPFSINVRSFLEKLSEVFPLLRDEDLPIDAEILSKIADIIGEQEEWLTTRTSLLALGQLVALIKIRSFESAELARDFVNAWRPIVEMEQVTFTDILRSLSYLDDRMIFRLVPERSELQRFSEKDLEELGLASKVNLKDFIRRMEVRISEILEERSYIEYGEIVRGRTLVETYLNAYAVAYLSTRGSFGIAYDPIKDKYYITKIAPTKGRKFVSMAIPLRSITYAD